MKHRTITEF